MKVNRFPFKFRTLFWAGAALLLAVLLLFVFRPRPVLVDLGEITRGALTVAVRDEARTRVRDIYVVSAPVSGRLLRVGNRAGERVEAGAVIAVIQPGPPVFVDERSRQEIQAGVRAAEAALALARAELERTEAQLAHARIEAERSETLFAANVVSQSALDRARLNVRTAAAVVGNARAGVGVRQADLEAVRVRLIEPAAAGASGRTVTIRAPVAGRVLRVLQESESVVVQGAPVMEIGDPGDLEVVAELLSSDAARISAGAPAVIDAWGDGPALQGRVRQVEPYGFLKISALGVEEQRVNVIIDLIDPPAAWAAVGHGYRVEAAVTVWRADAVVRAPVAALFRHQGQWAVFKVEGGRARLQRIGIGQNNGVLAEVRLGLTPADRVLLHPGESVSDGVRIRVRSSSPDRG
ncbi:MAG: HlyD family efflux transporter periplasmic adaptor subunit [Brevundimonas sp.]|uniref:efflux RND transporter periplasmic adaptor subunit n=1 Tax=Brevundimonas sp. TaxID=1871086 RepID=UPI00271ED786|nr:HlyD family efflux transporter periplasmic adaptor subunit [Brevundimonas sp.]MDO9586997.1 HlyD family efflux transporter periplasmic adaptor subunit [Brevundimonas sp.]MDP3658276.1 HlyD family efflux transporter periplasmic adaptor subunit [Brevundimonas sp.]